MVLKRALNKNKYLSVLIVKGSTTILVITAPMIMSQKVSTFGTNPSLCDDFSNPRPLSV